MQGAGKQTSCGIGYTSQTTLHSLRVHYEVDNRIDGGIGHGQPEEEEEHVLGVAAAGQLLARSGQSVTCHVYDVTHRAVEHHHEVCVVGQPAHTEHDQNHDEHLRHLPHLLAGSAVPGPGEGSRVT